MDISCQKNGHKQRSAPSGRVAEHHKSSNTWLLTEGSERESVWLPAAKVISRDEFFRTCSRVPPYDREALLQHFTARFSLHLSGGVGSRRSFVWCHSPDLLAQRRR